MNYYYKATTKDTMRRHTETYWLRRFHKKSSIVTFVVSLLLAACVVYKTAELTYIAFKFHNGHIDLLLILLWVITLALLGIILFAPQISSMRKLRHNAKVSGQKERYSETYFYDNHFSFHSAISNTVTNVFYADISKIAQTKNFYVIFTANQMVYACEKAGFEDQKATEAYQFLCSKIAPKN